jgi:predicted  nucleic acid-binding Zn-ribbon protein
MALEKKVNFLEAQNLNLSLVHQEFEDLKIQNSRLQTRLKESKNKSQILAYTTHDSKELLARKKADLQGQLSNATGHIDQLKQRLSQKEAENQKL